MPAGPGPHPRPGNTGPTATMSPILADVKQTRTQPRCAPSPARLSRVNTERGARGDVSTCVRSPFLYPCFEKPQGLRCDLAWGAGSDMVARIHPTKPRVPNPSATRAQTQGRRGPGWCFRVRSIAYRQPRVDKSAELRSGLARSTGSGMLTGLHLANRLPGVLTWAPTATPAPVSKAGAGAFRKATRSSVL